MDPATGTGTFLAEVIREIYAQNRGNQGSWNSFVTDYLIPRINGFELLMASYAMAHLKLDIVLKETGFDNRQDKRLNVYLTNSLDNYKKAETTPFMQWLSNEANEANAIKKDAPIMVVLGNPPYNVSSSNNGEWIQSIMGDYKKDLNERNIQPLSDDYIKFIRFGQFYIDKNGEGILAYISNNSFIDGIIHRQMRKMLLENFDKIYIVDLHGNSKKKETSPDGSKDENVFDIQQGVSINIFVNYKQKSKGELAKVYHYDLYGKREGKYSFLSENSLRSVKWTELTPQAPQYFFINKNFEYKEEYERGFSLQGLFPVNSMGITTANDDVLVDFKPHKENNQQYSYRPFDIRFIKYDLEKIARSRYNVMQHFMKDENLGLCFVKISRDYNFSIFATNHITDKTLLSPLDNASIFPLYLYHDNLNHT